MSTEIGGFSRRKSAPKSYQIVNIYGVVRRLDGPSLLGDHVKREFGEKLRIRIGAELKARSLSKETPTLHLLESWRFAEGRVITVGAQKIHSYSTCLKKEVEAE